MLKRFINCFYIVLIVGACSGNNSEKLDIDKSSIQFVDKIVINTDSLIDSTFFWEAFPPLIIWERINSL